MVLSLALDLSHHRLITGEPQLLITCQYLQLKPLSGFFSISPKTKTPPLRMRNGVSIISHAPSAFGCWLFKLLLKNVNYIKA
jgi:hypothetical protein